MKDKKKTPKPMNLFFFTCLEGGTLGRAAPAAPAPGTLAAIRATHLMRHHTKLTLSL